MSPSFSTDISRQKVKKQEKKKKDKHGSRPQRNWTGCPQDTFNGFSEEKLKPKFMSGPLKKTSKCHVHNVTKKGKKTTTLISVIWNYADFSFADKLGGGKRETF